MNVARRVDEVEPRGRALAIGTFDGVHLGHRRVIQAAIDSGLTPTVITFDPHPRIVLGSRVEMLTTVRRRLELLRGLGVETTLVVPFNLELARLSPEEFADAFLRPIGAELVVAEVGFRFGRGRTGDLAVLARLGFETRAVSLVEGVSSSLVRKLLRAGEIEATARLLGRPPDLDGTVAAGYARGGQLGFPTANLRVEADLLVPALGIYAGAALGHRAAISIGTNPHYGGEERTIEAHLLDFAGDLYGRRLVLELWQRLRDERAFPTEAALVEQIARDVDAARAAVRPA
jgi:riboflavin kinase / FMN adenylyltransferase